ncbi:hypothetical protein [Pseudoalteromonas sp. NBT06-2]|uniref:hypothetical protein n=1 Tax=Pseudoalteromonas sp. NBT06-2 TaxID=2025950 RepID=UPI002074D4EB|nr:hypothetical protein [Pseudoalteromonas sp. NBT06-2]
MNIRVNLYTIGASPKKTGMQMQHSLLKKSLLALAITTTLVACDKPTNQESNKVQIAEKK